MRISHALKLAIPPKVDTSLKSCPFCGAPAEIEYWHGGGPNKRLIRCSNELCDVSPATTGETKAEAIRNWERRA